MEPGLYRILRNRNNRLHPNPKTNFLLVHTLILIPVYCQLQLFFTYIYHHHPLSQNRKSSSNHFRSHRLSARQFHHPREAFHKHLHIYLNKTPSLRPRSPSIVHHVFRSQNQIRNANQYPIPFPSPALQPRNERLLEMLQMPTHEQSSRVITLLRQLPTCER